MIQIKQQQGAPITIQRPWYIINRAVGVGPHRTATIDLGDELDRDALGLLDLPPTAKQRRWAFAVVTALAAALGVVAPFAAMPLPRFAAFIPFLNATILVTDLITALLLFAQFSLRRSLALLVLAAGYLFTALIVIPHALTFPGAFAPTGILGAGLQTAAWLYMFWHFGFPIALIFYAGLKDEKKLVPGSVRWTIGWTVAIITALVLGLVLLTTVGDPFLPRLFLDPIRLSPVGAYGPLFDLLVCAAALVFLWLRQRSVLDLWLMVVACALIGELALTVIRFSLGFYASRMFSLATSTIVLIMLLGETTKLYARLAHTNTMLERERYNKLMNLDAMVAAISHELKQPLSAMLLKGRTALLVLERTPPVVEKVQSSINGIISDVHRTSEVFNNIRELFKTTDGERVPINVNEMALGTLDLLQDDLNNHHITPRTELMSELRLIFGHKGQLQEVLLNVIRNAIEAMDEIEDKPRILRIRTANHGRDSIIITVEDTGPGIDPEKLESIFEVFITTKPQGMGLGLAICRMIIERHGGQLFASPSNNGGVFQIILPVGSAVEGPKPADRDSLVDRDALLHVKNEMLARP